jgi:Protein of unknown function (DUF3223)
MSRSKTLIVGNKMFKSKNEAEEFFREVIRRNISGAELTGEDRLVVERLLYLHPDAIEKVGTGVVGIMVLPDNRGSHCFFIRRVDGSLIDFSPKPCIYGRKPPFARFSEACRSAISVWMREWRQGQLENSPQRELGLVQCSVTGEWLPLADTDADHVPPMTFAQIVRDFAVQRGLDIDNFDAYLDGGTENLRFEDQSLSEAFHVFHASVAALRIVKRIENQRTAYLGRLDRQQASA